MATEAQLIEALRRADQAGNTEDARRLAQAIGAMRKGGAAAPRGRTFITEAQPWEDTRSPAEQAAASRDQGVAQGYAAPGNDGGLLGDWGVPGFADARQRDAYVERQNRNAPGRLATAVQGATLGFGDEILGGAAGLGSMVGGGTFNEGYAPVRDAIRENAGRYASENPVSAVGITLASAVPTAIALTPRALMEASAPAARYIGGAGLGAAFGAASGFGEGEGGLQNRMDAANNGAWLGTGLGIVAEGLGSTLGPVVRRALNSRRVRVIDASGQPTQEAIQMAQEAGLDPASVPGGLWQRIQAIADRGGAPGVAGAADAIRAESLPVPVPMSRGQLTGDRAILAKEYAIARGSDGGTGMNIMGDLRDRQQAALAANIPAMRERLAGGSPVVERGQGGEIVSARVNELNDAARQRAADLYARARELDAAGAPARVPFAPTDTSAASMAPPVEGYVPEMTSAVRFGRQGNETVPPGIIHEIQKMGGVRVVDRQGRVTPEGADLLAIFDGRVPPGFINNQSGRPLDYAREALGEAGWFPGRDPQEVSTADLLDLIAGRARNPMNSGREAAREAAARDRVRSDMEAAGITGRTPEDTAAGRLSLQADARARGEADPVFGRPPEAPPAVMFQQEGGLDIARRVFDRVRTDHAPANVPKVWAEVQGIGRAIEGGTLSPRLLFETRNRLNGIRSGGGEDAVAAGKAIRELDAAISDAVDRSLLAGDEEAIAAFRQATANYREYARAFKQKDFVSLLTARDFQNNGRLVVDPREATNAIFGTSDLGFVSKRDITRNLVNLREVVGADSDAWNAIRQEAFNRIANQSRGAQEPGGAAFSGAKLAKAWEDASARNPEVLRLLFSAEERRDIGNFANVARRATTVDSAVRAPSTSPFQMNRIMENVAKRIPVVGLWLSEGLRNAKGAFAARQATSGRLYDIRNRDPIPLNALVPGATQATLGP